MRRGRSARLALVWTLSFIMLAAALFPYLWMLFTSIRPETDIWTSGFSYFPKRLTLENYERLMRATPIGRYFVHSTIVATLSTFSGLGVAVTAAYAFSRYRFVGRALLMTLFLVIPMFPATLILIPMLVVMTRLHLIGTYVALLIAYTTFVIPFSVWMLTGFFDAIPKDLEEAAMTDGCSRLGAVRRVLVPLAMPGVVATGIYIFIVAWNEFLFALMFTTQATRTLPVGIYMFVGEYDVRWGLLTASGVAITIPLVILFSLAQGHLVRGLTTGAIRG